MKSTTPSVSTIRVCPAELAALIQKAKQSRLNHFTMAHTLFQLKETQSLLTQGISNDHI